MLQPQSRSVCTSTLPSSKSTKSFEWRGYGGHASLWTVIRREAWGEKNWSNAAVEHGSWADNQKDKSLGWRWLGEVDKSEVAHGRADECQACRLGRNNDLVGQLVLSRVDDAVSSFWHKLQQYLRNQLVLAAKFPNLSACARLLAERIFLQKRIEANDFQNDEQYVKLGG